MRVPRDLSGRDLARALQPLGYEITRQKGSHIRLTRTTDDSQSHITIPNHDALRVGTLAAVLGEVANQLGMTRDDLVQSLLV